MKSDRAHRELAAKAAGSIFLHDFYPAMIMLFTLLCYLLGMEVRSMRSVWNIINTYETSKTVKNLLFIWSQIILHALIGAAIWYVFGWLVFPGIDWLVCFIGYPAIFVGFFGSVLYLYNNEFA